MADLPKPLSPLPPPIVSPALPPRAPSPLPGPLTSPLPGPLASPTPRPRSASPLPPPLASPSLPPRSPSPLPGTPSPSRGASPVPRSSPKMGSRSASNINIANMVANLDATLSPGGLGGRRPLGGGGGPSKENKENVVVANEEKGRKGSLDLGVMGEWLKDREKVGLYFEGEGGEVGEEEGKKKKKEKKGDKKDKVQTVYGLPLAEMYEQSGYPIPIVVAQCMSYLKQSGGLKLEGIFRISAPKKEVDRLKTLYKTPTTIVNLSEETDNPHVIACLLKQYFTMMPDPLFPSSEMDAFAKFYQENEGNLPLIIEKLVEILQRIPYLECSLLRFLIQFLSQLGGYSEVNFMTPDNLGICFGPNLIRFLVASTSLMGAQIEAKVTAILIKNYSQIFSGLAEGDPPPVPEKKEKKKKPRPRSTLLSLPSSSTSSLPLDSTKKQNRRIKSQVYTGAPLDALQSAREAEQKGESGGRLKKLGASTSALPINVRKASPSAPAPFSAMSSNASTSLPAMSVASPVRTQIPSSPALPPRPPSALSPVPRSPSPLSQPPTPAPLPPSPFSSPSIHPPSPAPLPPSPALPPRSPSAGHSLAARSPSPLPAPSPSPLPAPSPAFPPRNKTCPLPPRSPLGGGFQDELSGVLKGRKNPS